jgi:peptide/nickel transport system substrate-binding protein
MSSARRSTWKTARRIVPLLFLVLLAACAPAQPGASTTAPNPSAPEQSQSRGPKTLRVGIHLSNEPREGIAAWGVVTGVSANDMNFVYHAGLTIQDPAGNIQPWVAQRVPSIENGDWKVAPDGAMEVTWRLRPDVKWHDGTPLTAKDFVFGTEVRLDKSLGLLQTGVEQVSGLSAPDDHTLAISYKAPFIYAHVSPPGQIRAVPAHLIEDLYRKGETTAFLNAPYWTSEFVGLGPYRLTEWSLGSHMEAQAFDQYFLGRPKIDRLVFRYIGDITVTHATLMAGELDVVPMGTFQSDSFARIKQDFQGAGLGTAFAVLSGTRSFKYQFRFPDDPWATDVRVRRALIHMLDREALVETLQNGQVTVADTTISPTHPSFALLKERGLPHYGYDLNEAARLMGQAGWTRGADGTYRNAAGRPFEFNVMSRDLPLNMQEATAVAAQLKAAGVPATTSASGKGAVSIQEQESTNRGWFSFPLRESHTSFAVFTNAQIGTAANGWRGSNFGGYSSAAFDRVYERSTLSFDANERNGLIADFLKILADDVAAMDIYYTMSQNTVVHRKQIHGPAAVYPEQLAVMWNINSWELD